MQPVNIESVLVNMEGTYQHPRFAVNLPCIVPRQTEHMKAFGKQSIDEKAHSLFNRAKNHGLEFRLVD